MNTEHDLEVMRRLVRIESRLTVLLRAFDLDNHGQPLAQANKSTPSQGLAKTLALKLLRREA